MNEGIIAIFTKFIDVIVNKGFSKLSRHSAKFQNYHVELYSGNPCKYRVTLLEKLVSILPFLLYIIGKPITSGALLINFHLIHVPLHILHTNILKIHQTRVDL